MTDGRAKRLRTARKEPAGERAPWGDRRLVVLEGGSCDGWWYFEDHVLQRVVADERMGRAWPYEATVRTRVHPQYAATGVVWTYVGEAAKAS